MIAMQDRSGNSMHIDNNRYCTAYQSNLRYRRTRADQFAYIDDANPDGMSSFLRQCHCFLALRYRLTAFNLLTSLSRPGVKRSLQSYRETKRYSILELQKDRFWTQVAGVDPKTDRVSADVWMKYKSITVNAYLEAGFDVSSPWNSQEPVKKQKAHSAVVSGASQDLVLRGYPGLLNHDLIAWRLCQLHRNQRQNLQKIAKENRLGHKSPYIPEIIEAMQKGEIRLLRRAAPHKHEALSHQGARVALPRSVKRQESNELHFHRQRLALKDEPIDREAESKVLSQAPNRRSASAMKRWQRWREALRSGELDIHTRLWSDESRQKMSEATKGRLAKVEWTSEMREMKRRVGAIGLERQRQERANQQA